MGFNKIKQFKDKSSSKRDRTPSMVKGHPPVLLELFLFLTCGKGRI